MSGCECFDYRWVHSAQEARDLKAEGWVYAGESGRYPSIILKRQSKHCGRCTKFTREVLGDLGRYVETCNGTVA